VKTSFGESLLKEGFLILVPYMVFLFVMMSFFSLERVCNRLRFLGGFLFCLVGGVRKDPYHGQS
jgi:hypothetical protein